MVPKVTTITKSSDFATPLAETWWVQDLRDIVKRRERGELPARGPLEYGPVPVKYHLELIEFALATPDIVRVVERQASLSQEEGDPDWRKMLAFQAYYIELSDFPYSKTNSLALCWGIVSEITQGKAYQRNIVEQELLTDPEFVKR